MKQFLCSIAALLLCASCGTLFGDKSDKITIDSDPAGAEVLINGEIKGKTPLEVVLERDTFKTVTAQVKKKGYDIHDMRVSKTFNPTSLFNIGFITTTGGVTSWGIDALTGGVVQYSPTKYMVTLKKTSASSEKPSKTLYVFVNEEKLRRDIAQGGGAYLDALFEVYALDLGSEMRARGEIYSQRTRLLKIEKASEFDAALRALIAPSVASL